MGGRGSYSTSGKNRAASGTAYNFGGAPDRRQDVQDVFKTAGFEEVRGTNRMNTAILGFMANTLYDLEKQYGAIAASDAPIFATFNGTATGAVFYDDLHPSDQVMGVNAQKFQSVGQVKQSGIESERTKWHPKTDGKITSRMAATVTHEYGHMLMNALAAQSGMTSTAFNIMAEREVKRIARRKFKAAPFSSSSRYGREGGAAEYLAEAFQSLHSGKPNAHGKAIGEWLKSHSLR